MRRAGICGSRAQDDDGVPEEPQDIVVDGGCRG